MNAVIFKEKIGPLVSLIPKTDKIGPLVSLIPKRKLQDYVSTRREYVENTQGIRGKYTAKTHGYIE